MYNNYNYRNVSQNMNYSNLRNQNSFNPTYNNNDRFFAGGFLGPFVLGGITGGLLAPAFNNNNGRPIYNNYYPPYPPYLPYPPYYYGPYYRS